MHIYIRRLLLLVSYTAFMLIAPLVVLYAIGYRPQVSSPIPRPVGVILADATPKRAHITVNGVIQGTLPRSVPNIDPGIATVQIAKEGYSTWEKQIEIKPTQATDLRSVQLLPASFTTETLAQTISDFVISPNSALTAAIQHNNQLIILDNTASQTFASQQLTGKPTAISWSPDNQYILLTFPQTTYQLFQVGETAITKITPKNFPALTTISWSPITSNTLYGLDKNHSVVLYDIKNGTQEIILKNVNTYEIANRIIYYQTFENELALQQLRSKDTHTLSQDTGKAIKKIIPTPSGTLALLFVDGELAIQKPNGDIETVSPHAENMFWSPDNQLLLIQTAPTELSVYNYDNSRLFTVPLGELRLITRLSQPITKPQWFSDSLHLLYQSNNTLFFSEIDMRDHAIALPIDTIQTNSAVAIGEESKHILYIQRKETTTNLVRTWLVTKEDR